MPDTTRIITVESGSRRSAKATLKSPDVIHENTCCTMARDSGARARSRQTAARDTTKEPSIAAQATAPAAALLMRRPKLAFSRKPRNGRSGISSNMGRRAVSPFELRKRVGVERLAMPEQADDNGESDRGLRGCDGH